MWRGSPSPRAASCSRGASRRASSTSPCLKPLEPEEILAQTEGMSGAITVEDHSVIGGLGGAVADVIARSGKGCAFRKLGYQDEFAIVGAPEDLLNKYKLDADGILECISEVIKAEFEVDENWDDED